MCTSRPQNRGDGITVGQQSGNLRQSQDVCGLTVKRPQENELCPVFVWALISTLEKPSALHFGSGELTASGGWSRYFEFAVGLESSTFLTFSCQNVIFEHLRYAELLQVSLIRFAVLSGIGSVRPSQQQAP